MKQLFRNLLASPEKVFLIVAGSFGLLSVFLMPILQIPDENQHFQVSYAVFSANERASDDLVLNEEMVLGYSEQGYETFFFEKTDAANDGIKANARVYVFNGKTPAGFLDIMRLPQATGVLVGRLIHPSIGSMVSFGRIFNLIVFLVAIYFIIKKVRYGKWIFVFVACLPIVIQQAASLSYDSTNLIIIFAWVAFMINLFAREKPIAVRHLLVGALLVGLLYISKSNNLLLVALLLGLPARLILETKPLMRIKESRHWKTLRTIAYAIAVIGFVAALYVMSMKLLAGNELDIKKLGGVLLNTFVRGDNLALIDAVTVGIFGYFSNFYYHLPVWVIVFASIVLAIGLLHEKLPKVTKRFALISGGLFIASILLVSIGMYYAWAIQPFRLGPGALVTDGIQGRYFTPLLVLLFPLFAYLQRFVVIKPKHPSTVPIIMSVTSVLLLALYSYQTWHFFWV